jgi:multiple sugar transport system permease protein
MEPWGCRWRIGWASPSGTMLRDQKNRFPMTSPIERRHFRKTTAFAYRILLPSLAFVIVFIGYPLFYSISIAFKEYKYGVPTGKIIWFKNFFDILTNPTVAPLFYNSLVVTLKFAVVSVAIVVVISLGIALLINERFRGSDFLKIALLLPYAIPGPVNSVMWNWIYDPNFGVLNGLLFKIGLIKDYFTITGNPNLALWGISFAYIWKFVPYSAFLFLAGLSTIPRSVYEAAEMDRAGTLRTFFKITLPLLMPVFQMVLVIQTIFALLMHFALVFVLTRGGPGNATTTLAWLIYNESFTFTRFGRGAAMAIFLSLIMIAFIYVYLVILNPEKRSVRQQGT